MTPSALSRSATPPVAALKLWSGTSWRSCIRGLVGAAAWLTAAWVTAFWPDRPDTDWAYTGTLSAIFAAQGWAAYANMYAALFIMAAVCSGLVTLLFRLRDRLLSWQRGLLRW